MKDNIWQGLLSFIGLQAVLTPIGFPPFTLYKLTAGFICMKAFDSVAVAVMMGTTVVFVGSVCGSLVSFYISRLVLKHTLLDYFNKHRLLKGIQKAARDDGMKVLFMIRMTPLVPYSLLNYLMGSTDIKVGHFVAGSAGLLPQIVIKVLMGTCLSSISEAFNGDYSHINKLTLCISMTASFMSCFLVAYIIKRVRQILNEYSENDDCYQAVG